MTTMMKQALLVAVTVFSSLPTLLLLVVLNLGHCTSQPLWNDVCSGADSSDYGDHGDDRQKGAYLFCNKELSLSERVEDYVRRIPTTSKIDMMGNAAKGYSPLHIPPYQWWSEGLVSGISSSSFHSTTALAAVLLNFTILLVLLFLSCGPAWSSRTLCDVQRPLSLSNIIPVTVRFGKYLQCIVVPFDWTINRY